MYPPVSPMKVFRNLEFASLVNRDPNTRELKKVI